MYSCVKIAPNICGSLLLFLLLVAFESLIARFFNCIVVFRGRHVNVNEGERDRVCKRQVHKSVVYRLYILYVIKKFVLDYNCCACISVWRILGVVSAKNPCMLLTLFLATVICVCFLFLQPAVS